MIIIRLFVQPYRNIDAIEGFSFWQTAMTAIFLSQLTSSYFTKTRIKATHSLLRKCTMYRPKGEHNSDKPFWLSSRINIPIRLHKQSILLDKTRIWLGMARKAFYIPYPRFIVLDKTRIWLGMARKTFYIPHPRFILLDKTRIWPGMARKAFYIPHPRFILLDKTRIWLGMARNTFYIPYPRFILLDNADMAWNSSKSVFYTISAFYLFG